jgi:hypothetical protein
MKIRFIKLGGRGEWEASCIERDNTIRLGYESPHHRESLTGNWETVRQYWLQFRNQNEGQATRDLNQIRDFYELAETDIWVTFYKRSMYWCHARKDAYELEDGTRVRQVIGAWSNCDKTGKPLTIENIDGRVTKVQGFRGTICGIELPDYVLRKIKGETQPEVEAAKKSLQSLKSSIESLIKGLWWSDFELLVDLIFAKSGWQRTSVLGKTEKDIDLDVFSPVNHKRAFVQVKSSTDAAEITAYYERYKQYEQFDEMYFVFHSFLGDPQGISIDDQRLYIWDLSRIAELVIHTGLVDWLITKRS